MKITIDQVIAKLNEAKAAVGGDGEVCFWRDSGNHFVLDPKQFGDNISQLTFRHGNSRGVSFEINRVEND